jgi:exodeoxyribonuclease V alpha subunit
VSAAPIEASAPDGVLRRLVAAEHLTPSDLALARALCRLGGERSADVLLAVALAVAAPRHGHVCVDLPHVVHEAADPEVPVVALWRATLAASPLVREAGEKRTTPLVLDGDRLWLDRYFRYRGRLLQALQARIGAPPPDDIDAARLREDLVRWFGPPAAEGEAIDRARLAAVAAVLGRFTLITGGPGTGKTTTIARVLLLLLSQRGPGLRVALCAPTGKAAARIREAIDAQIEQLAPPPELRLALARASTFTLHRLLGSRFGAQTRFRHDRDHPLPWDVVVVDEGSMVSFALLAKLVDAIEPAARLILLGDRDQLASVEAGAVLGDLCSPPGTAPILSRGFVRRMVEATGEDLGREHQLVPRAGIWDHGVELVRVHRFAAGSGIARLAGAVQAGDPAGVLDVLRGGGSEVEWIEPTAEDELPGPVGDAVVDGWLALMRAVFDEGDPDRALAATDRVRVLCAHRRGPLGVEPVGVAIEDALARAWPRLQPDLAFYAGRPVMVTENDHALQLFNGDVGVTMAQGERRVVVFRRPGGGLRRLSPVRLPPCETVFATSIHKSQGSQFEHAIVVLPAAASRIVTRELLYTGVTRARLRVTVVAREEVLVHAVRQPISRASGLRSALWPAADVQAGAQLALFSRG